MILNILLITALTKPLFSITPDAVLSYSRTKVLTLTESTSEEDRLQFYTYYQAKILNELINNKETQESSLWGLLEKGANTENTEQSNLEWHAATLKAQNWGDSKDFKWIHATSEIDMVLGFLSSSYTSICLAGSTTVQNINTILDQIQKQSFYFLQASPSFTADTPHPETIKLVIQLGRNAYYKKLYIQDESQACAVSASVTENEAIPIQPTQTTNIDLLAAHIADLEYDESSDTDFNELLENSYTVISNGTDTAEKDRATTQTSNAPSSPDHSTEIQMAKQKDYLLSAIHMLFPHTHTYEGIQFNTFLDFVTPKLTRNFVTQKIEECAKKNSVFLDEGLFELEDFQNDGDGNYTLKKSRYQVALEHADFKDELTREAFEDYARAMLFNSMVSYFIELNSTYPNGAYRYPTAHQSLIDETSGLQAFHSGHVIFTESKLLDLPTTILNGFGKVNGTNYEYGLLAMYDLQLPHIIHAIKQNPYI